MGGFLRKIFGHLGFFKDDSDLQDSGGGVPSKLSVNPKNNRPYNLPPVVSECIPGAGGIQGLQWYAEKLKMDEDGDVAQEFLTETITSPSALDNHNLEAKIPAKPIRLKGPICILNGNVYQYVETVPGVHSKC